MPTLEAVFCYFARATRWIGKLLCVVAASSFSLAPFAAAVTVGTSTGAFAQDSCDLSGTWKTSRGPMRLSLPEGNVSALINAPAGLESLRATAAEGGLAVTLITAVGATLTGALDVTPDCASLTGDIGGPFLAKRLVAGNGDDVDDPAAIAEMFQSLNTAQALLDDVASHVDMSPNDPASVLTAAGRAPEALRQWVATNTILLPYEGALRSPEQVLADRHGNSLDRARLLVFLLEQSGVPARLARGELPEDALAALYDIGTRELPARPVLFTGYDLDTLSDRVPSADVAQIAADAEAMAAADNEEAVGPALRIFDNLAPLVRPAAETTPALSSEYWWVQYDEGGTWTSLALDPLPGLPDPVEVLASGDLPEEIFHRLTVKVLSEGVGDQGELVESEVYSGSIFAQQAALGQLRLSFLPGGVPLDLSASDILYRASDTLDALIVEPAWVPILSIDEEFSVDNVLVLDGRSLTPDEAVQEGLAKHLFGEAGGADNFLTEGGGLFGDFADILNGDVIEPTTIEDRLTAIYIEYVIDSPYAEPRVERRTLWDRLGAARRMAGDFAIAPLSQEELVARVNALADTRHIVVQTMMEPQESLFKRLAVGVAIKIGYLKEALVSVAQRTAPDELRNVDPGGLAPLFFELERRAAFALNPLTAMQRPDIVSYIERPAPAADGGFPEPDIQMDIVQTGVVPYWFGVDPFGLRLLEGIGATLAEAETTDRGIPVQNAARAYLKSLDDGTAWRVYASAEALRQNPVPVEIATLVAAELDRGNIVVAPDKPIALETSLWSGYWRINPHTGETLGVDPRGGATFSEYLTKIHGILGGSEKLKKFIAIVNIVTRVASLAFCLTSFYYSDGGALALTMLALCAAGEALNLASNARALSKFFAGRAAGNAAKTVENLKKAGFEKAAAKIFEESTKKMLNYTGTIGTKLDEVYAFGAALGNGLKFLSGAGGLTNNLLKKRE